MSNQLQWLNVLSTRPSLEGALDEITQRLTASLTETPNLGILFVASAYISEYPRIIPLLQEKLSIPILIGCGGGGIVGMKTENQVLEIEGNTAISLTVLNLPNVEITPFHLKAEDLPDLDSSPQNWIDLIGVSPEKEPDFILLSDPFSAKINDLLEGLDFAYPGSVKIGGLASSGSMGASNSLFFYTPNHPAPHVISEGTIGVALSGKIVLETIVAQGCKPIGKPYQITKGERNIILELATDEVSKPPLVLLQELVNSLDEKERELAQHSLFLGIARDEFKSELTQGDFLIRNLLGVDPRMGAIAVGDRIRPGQRIQFHLRDAHTSAEDLELLLSRYQQQNSSNTAVGALLFSCLGRGERLYNQPNFDSELFLRYFPDIPLGGFFCNGEIGPVGNTTFLHGYTSAFGIFSMGKIE
jgi:small ligand-binding sensory domain FIST